MAYTPDELRQAAALLNIMRGGQKSTGFKHDLTPAAGVAPYAHGNGGLFNTPGTDARIFSAMSMPLVGLLEQLPVMPPGTSMGGAASEYGGYDTPFFTTVTGVTAGDLDLAANQPDAPCDDPPEPGLMKLCTLTSSYGRFYGKIRAVELTRLGRLQNNAEPINLQLVNQYAVDPITSQQMGGNLRNGIDSELNVRLFEAAVSWKRLIAPKVYTGDPTNNAAGGGYREFPGLDLLINTGNKIDAITGNVCTALNSIIDDFGYELINGTGNSLVEYVDSIYANLEWTARQNGLSPVEWVLVMRPEAFDEITKVWPIRYYEEALLAIAGINPNNEGQVIFDARDTTAMRDDMRNNQFLPIRGKRVRVVLDDSIAEDNVTTNENLTAGQFASDIYFVPLTVLGGIPVTYLEAFYYNNGQVNRFLELAGGLGAEQFRTSDGGRFLWWTARTNTCIDFRWVSEFRIIMRTPQLAARLQNVAYQPLRHFRSADPSSFYFTNGGRTNTPVSSYYSEWATESPS